MSNALVVSPKYSNLIPPLTSDEYAALEVSILTEGVRDPLVLWGNVLIDGHNRYAICKQHSIHFETIQHNFLNEAEAELWIIQNQLARRNLNAYQRTALVLQEKEATAKAAKERQGTRTDIRPNSDECNMGRSDDKLAERSGVGRDTFRKVEFIENTAPEVIKQQARSAEISTNAAYEMTKAIVGLSEEQAEALVESGELEDRKTRQKMKRMDTDTKRAVIDKIASGEASSFAKAMQQTTQENWQGEAPDLPDGIHNVLYVDPPWRYEHSKTESRKIENQYPTMALEEICELPVPTIAAEDTVLFMWATSPKLAESMQVIEAWGFNYRTCMVWVKDKIGMGYYARQRHELLLIAIKGTPGTPEPSVRPDSVIEAPRLEHSAKPECVYDLIERMYPDGKRIELFARNERPNWSSWGNQV